MLKIYREADNIVIEESAEKILIPYSDAVFNKLQGDITFDESKGYLINGIELCQIII